MLKCDFYFVFGFTFSMWHNVVYFVLELTSRANMMTSWIYTLVILPLMLGVSSTTGRLSIGPEAQRLCRTYRKVCTAGRFCAMQYFHTPRNISLPICVPEYFIPAEHRRCDLQPDHGKCGARYIRWFYHKGQNKCNWFYYGGCEGNQNNFKSKQECEDTCRVEHTAIDNNAHNRHKAIALPVKTSPVVISEPLFLPERNNQITRSFSLRSKRVGPQVEKERRRKRRLRERKKRRLQKIKRRRRKLNVTPRKRRRDGKISGRKRRNRKKRRQGRKNRKRNKNRKNRKHKDKKDRPVEGKQNVDENEKQIKDNQMTNEKRTNNKRTAKTDSESQSPPKTLTVLDTGDEASTDDIQS